MDPDELIGQSFGHYRIVEKLGQGGMGMVFKASDIRLQRTVAIKILPEGKERLREKRERFLIEARAASALNHPHIVTIHEIGQQGDMDFIVMEYIAGRSLHELIHSRGLSLSETLRYAVQIADAMAAAHAAGIVHRDLKPGNILINERGMAKVVDFGLAKRADANDQAATRTLDPLTMEGFAVGTLPYMSPEQAEGKRVDARADIFAFGAILYEMVTGRRAFQGETPASTLLAIVSRDPDPPNSTPTRPNELDRLIARCLRKDPERRAQSAGDLKIALEELREIWESTHTLPASSLSAASAPRIEAQRPLAAPAVPTTDRPAETPGKRRWIAGALAALAGIAIGGWYLYGPAAPAAFKPPLLKRITSETGLTAWPALSPDGKLLAYASDRGEDTTLHIWLQQVGGGQAIKLTDSDADDSEPSFSRDGTRVAYHSEREGGGIYIVPALGGESRLIAPRGRRPVFSPDGRRIAYWVGGDFGKLYVVDSEGGEPRPLQVEFISARYPVWSPDGRHILFAGYRHSGDNDWWITPAGSGQAIKTGIVPALKARGLSLGGGFGDLAPAAWLPGDAVVFSARKGDAVNVWRIRISPKTMSVTGPPEQLTFGTYLEMQASPSVDSSGALRTAFATLTHRIDLWSLPLDAKAGTAAGEMRRITEGGSDAGQVSITADGGMIAFLWDRNGRQDAWIRNLTTRKTAVVTTSTTPWVPAITARGDMITWSAFSGDKPQGVYRALIGADGHVGVAEPLCADCGTISSWSYDGRWGADVRPPRVLAVDRRTGEKREILNSPEYMVWGARFSPDGRRLVVNCTIRSVEYRIFLVPFDPGRSQPVPGDQWIPITDGKTWDDKPRWAPDGKAIYFLSDRDGFRCVWRQPLDAGTGRPEGAAVPVRHFHHARLSMMNLNIGPLSMAVGPDKLVVNLGEVTGNVWMATETR